MAVTELLQYFENAQGVDGDVEHPEINKKALKHVLDAAVQYEGISIAERSALYAQMSAELPLAESVRAA